MTIATPVSKRSSKRGFTLVELLLTVAMIVMLAGAVIYNFGVLDKAARLDETASIVESLLRYARAQASSRGREVRVVFGDSGAASVPVTSTNSTSTAQVPGVQVLWEPDPLGAPGQFKPLPGAETLIDQLNDIARVREVRPPGTNSLASMAQPNAAGAAAKDSAPSEPGAAVQGPMPVTFYPDGSSDSVEIVLGSTTESDNRGLMVSLSGTTGSMSHRLVSMGEDGTLAANPANEVDLSADGDAGNRP